MTLSEAIERYPNDYELGHYFSVNYHSLDDFNQYMGPRIIHEYPNYYELGNYLRTKFINEIPSN
jgi:hypothetical protein